MNKVRERILKEVENAKYEDLLKHEDLISFNVCDGYLSYNPDTDEEEESDFDELTVVVVKNWLFDLIKKSENLKTDDEVRRFLHEEYTSDDSSHWYADALLRKKIVAIDFN